jgi:hypothetical protein
VFCSLFEANKDDQNILLEVAINTLKFPPAVRALHDLIQQTSPSQEDRTALTQCLMEYYKKIKDPVRTFDAQFPRLVFAQLYQQARASTSISQYLDAMKSQNFLCQTTKQPVVKGLLLRDGDDEVIIDASVALLYTNGPLRGTFFDNKLAPAQGTQIFTRLCLYNGGRFEDLTYYDNETFSKLSTTTRLRTIVPSDRDHFAIIPPKDLTPIEPPALTRDATGTVNVYLGKGMVKDGGGPTHALLFNPLSGERTVDTVTVTSEIARARESNPTRYEFYQHGNLTTGRDPEEIIVILFDLSGSMLDLANFSDTLAVGNKSDLNRVRGGELVADVS